MGIYTQLYLAPRRIDADAWASDDDETLARLEAWPTRVPGWGTRELYGRKVPMDTRSIRDAEGDAARWSVAGDRESLQGAKCQTVPRSVGRHTASGDVEERFPQHVFVSGDTEREDAEVGRRVAAPILQRELPSPVVVDAPRLVEGLRYALDERALDRALDRRLRGHKSELLEAQVRARFGPRRRAMVARRARTGGRERRVRRSPATHRVAQCRTFRRRCDAAGLRRSARAGRSPAAFIDALADSWLTIAVKERTLRAQRGRRERPRGRDGALGARRRPRGTSPATLRAVHRVAADAARLKRLLVHQPCGHPRALTEDAWDRPLALDDPSELAWVLALPSLVAERTQLSRPQRARLENPSLRAYAIAVSRDPRKMEEIASLVATTKASKG